MVTAPEWARRAPLAIPQRGSIPISDSVALRGPLRRTTLVRIVLGGLLLLLTAFAVWRAASLSPKPVPFLERRTTTIVVLDQSKSIYIAAYRRIASLFRALVAADAPVGVVAFSDTAYEMMPPGTHGTVLAPMLRFYTKARPGETNLDPLTNFPASPWEDVFSGGTKISAGIDLAQAIVHRDHVRNATIVLVSDLETAGEDQPALAQALLLATHDKRIHMKVLPLFPILDDMQFFQKFLPPSAFIKPAQLHVQAASAARFRLLVSSPWPLVVVGTLLLLALAVNELACARVLVVRPREATS
jgi:hypothetical protein